MAFNPQRHIRKIQGKDTLDAKWKVRWFRDIHPHGRIETDVFTVGDMIAVKAIVMDAESHFLASGMATVRDANQKEATWAGRIIEKAETAAIARALAHAGFSVETIESSQQQATDRPTAAKFNPSDRLSPEAHGLDNPVFTTGEIKAVDIKKTAKGKPYIVTEGGNFFSREAFRALAFPKEFIDKMEVVKESLFLPVPIRIAYTEIEVDGKKQRSPVSVMRVDTELEVQVK